MSEFMKNVSNVKQNFFACLPAGLSDTAKARGASVNEGRRR